MAPPECMPIKSFGTKEFLLGFAMGVAATLIVLWLLGRF